MGSNVWVQLGLPPAQALPLRRARAAAAICLALVAVCVAVLKHSLPTGGGGYKAPVPRAVAAAQPPRAVLGDWLAREVSAALASADTRDDDAASPPTADGGDDLLRELGWIRDQGDAVAHCNVLTGDLMDTAGATSAGGREAGRLRAPPPAWDVRPGLPLAQAHTDWVRRQLARLRMAGAGVAEAAVAASGNVSASRGAVGVEDVNDEPMYTWPLTTLFPLPAVVLAGSAAGGTDSSGQHRGPGASVGWTPPVAAGGRAPAADGDHTALRAAMSRWLRARAAASSAAPDVGVDPLRASRSVPLASVLSALLHHPDDDDDDARSAATPPPLPLLNGSGLVQPWLAPSFRFVVTRSTLATLHRAELRLLARALSDTCADLARDAAAEVFVGGLLLAGALVHGDHGTCDDDGFGADADADWVMRGGVRRRRMGERRQRRASAWASGGASSNRRRQGAAARATPVPRAASLTPASPSLSAAELPSTMATFGVHRLWHAAAPATPAPSHAASGGGGGGGLGAPSFLQPVVMSTVRVHVASSDARAVGHIRAPAAAAPAAAAAGPSALTPLDGGDGAWLDGIVAAAAAPWLPAPSPLPSTGGNNGSSPLADAVVSQLRSALTGRSRDIFADTPLPWLGSDETFLLTLDQGAILPEGVAGGFVVSTAAAREAALAWGPPTQPTASYNGSGADFWGDGFVSPPREAVGEVRSVSVWGALRGLQALSQVATGWALAVEAPPSASMPAASTAVPAVPLTATGPAALMTALHDHANAAAAAINNGGVGLPSPAARAGTIPPGVGTGLTQLSPLCAARMLRQFFAPPRDIPPPPPWAPQLSPSPPSHAPMSPDPSRALPIALPLTIADAPWKPVRALHVAAARVSVGRSGETALTATMAGVAVEELRQTLDALAAVRGNVLTWEATVCDGGSGDVAPTTAHCTSQADVARLVRYAADRGIRVVPVLQLLGDAGSACNATDATAGRRSLSGINVADAASAATAFSCFAATVASAALRFPDAHIHVGGASAAETAAALARQAGLTSTATPPPWMQAAFPQLLAALTSSAGTAGHANGDANGGLAGRALLALLLHSASTVLAAAGRVPVFPAALLNELVAGSAATVHARRLRSAVAASTDSNSSSPAIDALAANAHFLALMNGTAASAVDVSHALRAFIAQSLYTVAGSGDGSIAGSGRATAWAPRTNDESALGAADDALGGCYGDVDTASSSSGRLRAPVSLDADQPWEAVAMDTWPVPPRFHGTAAELAAACASQRWDRWVAAGSIGAPARPPRFDALALHFSAAHWAGGGAAVTAVDGLGATLVPRTWPRAAAALETLSSQSLALARLRRAATAANFSRAGSSGCGGAVLARSIAAATPAGWAWMGALVDGGGAQASLLSAAAPRMLRLSLRLWARGVGSAPLVVFSPHSLEPTGAAGIRALIDGTPGSCGTGDVAADGWGRCVRPPILPAALSPGGEYPPYSGMVPPATTGRLPPPPPAVLSESAPLGAPQDGPLLPPPPRRRQLRALLWNTDAVAALPGLRYRPGGGEFDPKPPALRPATVTAPGGDWWVAVSAVLRAAAAARYDVVAVVEAVGWHLPPSPPAAGGNASGGGDGGGGAHGGHAARRRRHLHSDAHGVAEAHLNFEHQTRAFRDRAAAAGFPFAHLTFSPAGYSLALLSSAPITLVFEESGTRFERALLAADSHGVRWVVAHLDGHNAYNRLREARWAAELGRRFSAVRGLPVAMLLDANGASPQDAACHAVDGWPHWLRNASSSPRLVKQFRRAGTAQLDYGALGALLQQGRSAALAANATSRASSGADTTVGSFTDASHPCGLQPRSRARNESTCGLVGRTRGGLAAVAAGGGAPPHPPVRTTFVLVNDAFTRQLTTTGPATASASGACTTLDSPTIRAASSYAPLACAWEGNFAR